MRGPWWQWLSAVLAIIFGLVFGWVAGTGVVQAAATADVPVVAAENAGRLGPSAGDAARTPAGRL